MEGCGDFDVCQYLSADPISSKELRINAKRVEIERKGETLVLRPLPDENCWPDGYLESFAAGKLDVDFERPPQGEHREIKS